MPACGQRALARISYLESTRAKAQLNRDQTDQFYTGNLANFAPGLTSAAAQTAVASFAYWLAGAPHWSILSLFTFMLGLIQIGPILIWLPLSIWLWVDGQIGMSIFVSVWGLIVVGLTDNVVKTLVVARGANLPAILAFLGAIGGLITWGIVGLFLGPVIVAVCYQIILSWLRSDLAVADKEPKPFD